jgi:hypothetical protein
MRDCPETRRSPGHAEGEGKEWMSLSDPRRDHHCKDVYRSTVRELLSHNDSGPVYTRGKMGGKSGYEGGKGY